MDTMSSVSSFTSPTPPASDYFQNPDNMLLFNSVPTPGCWYLIRARDSGKYLSVIDGKACLKEKPHPWAGIRWRYVTNDGWFGFHEFTSGRYLGLNKGKVVVIHPSHGAPDYLVVTHQPEGGYHISIYAEVADNAFGSGNAIRRLKPLKSGNGESLLPLEHKGPETVWEFCKLENPE